MPETTQNADNGQTGDSPPPGKTAPQAGAHEVLQRAEALSLRLQRTQAALARACRLRLPAYALLSVAAAAKEQGLTVSEAAHVLGVRPQALSGPAAELAEAGLLERQVDDADNRARRLKVTRQGLARLDMGAELKNRLAQEVAGQLPATNVVSLILEKLESALTRALNGANRA